MSRFTCLLYGAPGSGKTTMASTAPAPILLIDVDNKATSMVNLQQKISDGDLIVHPVMSKLSEDSLRQRVLAGSKPLRQPKGYLEICDIITNLEEGKIGTEAKTIVLDSLSAVASHLQRLILYTASVQQMRIQDWGTFSLNLEELITALLSLNKNIIVIAHESHLRDDVSGAVLAIKPLIEGRMKDRLGAYFEEVYFLSTISSKDGVEFRALTQNDSLRQCRSSRKLEKFIPTNFSHL